MATTNYTAGNVTLSGFTSEFSSGPAGQFTNPLLAGGYDFNWSAPTVAASGGVATGGTDAPQTITASSTGGDVMSLSLTFLLADGSGPSSQGGLHLFSGNTDVLDASTQGTFTVGGSAGESAAALQADIQNLRLVDNTFGDQWSIGFTLTDVTTSQSTTFKEFFATASCYAPGTRVATPSGEMAVEDLQIGDLVATVSGGAKPVKWIGRRSYSAADVAGAVNLLPVVIRQGALGAGLPQRDLMVSPMHALLIDDVFVPAVALLNGVSITRRETAGPAEYIHIELDQHDAIFAEGVPAETFVDDNSRAMFENVAEYYDLYGTTESPRGFSAPRIEEGYQLEAIRSRIAGQAARAVAPGTLAGHVEQLVDGVLEGWVLDKASPTAPVELEVLVDGEIVATVLANRYRVDLDRAGLAGGRCAFSVAMPASAESMAQIEVRRASDGGQVAMPQRALATV
jgi:hypothetical protein